MRCAGASRCGGGGPAGRRGRTFSGLVAEGGEGLVRAGPVRARRAASAEAGGGDGVGGAGAQAAFLAAAAQEGAKTRPGRVAMAPMPLGPRSLWAAKARCRRRPERGRQLAEGLHGVDVDRGAGAARGDDRPLGNGLEDAGLVVDGLKGDQASALAWSSSRKAAREVGGVEATAGRGRGPMRTRDGPAREGLGGLR